MRAAARRGASRLELASLGSKACSGRAGSFMLRREHAELTRWELRQHKHDNGEAWEAAFFAASMKLLLIKHSFGSK